MSKDNTQLPADFQKEHDDLIMKHTLELPNNNDYKIGYEKGMEVGIEIGATEYATRLHQVEQENAELKQWKREAAALLFPLLEYGQSKEAGIPLGQEITKIVLDRCKQFETARALLEKFISRHEACFVVDKELFTEIKNFLDGK